MERRRFLAALLCGAVMDPERLLWAPGKKLISIPAPRVYSGVLLTPKVFANIELIPLEDWLYLLK